jgi:hypothetical protein
VCSVYMSVENTTAQIGREDAAKRLWRLTSQCMANSDGVYARPAGEYTMVKSGVEKFAEGP